MLILINIIEILLLKLLIIFVEKNNLNSLI